MTPMVRFSNCPAKIVMSTLNPFFIYAGPWSGVSAWCLYTVPTFPPAAITTCPRNAQPQILLCKKSKSCQRQQHFFWALWTQTSLSLDSHIRCPWQWAETWRGCYPHYPQINGGTGFASIYSISLVKTEQLSGKSSITTAISVQQYQNRHLILLQHQKKSHLRTQESSPRMLSLSRQHLPLIQKPLS